MYTVIYFSLRSQLPSIDGSISEDTYYSLVRGSY